MKHSECILKVSDLITSQVDLSKAKLSNEFYYSSVVFCVIDAVFSINFNYASTINVVDRIAKRIEVNQFRLYGSSINRTEDTVGVSRYLYLTSNIDFAELANNYYGNRQRTSSKNRILKSHAVHEFLKVLERFEVDDFSDLKKIKGNENFENEIKLNQSRVKEVIFL